jgi:hypothetical protein
MADLANRVAPDVPPRTEASTPECNGAQPDATAVLEAQLDGLQQVTDLLRVQLEDSPRGSRQVA